MIAHSAQAKPAPVYRRSDFDHSPLIVFYEVTRACDLVCLHCRACAQAQPDVNELAPHQSRQLIDQLTEFPKPPLLVLTGGDPLKRGDIYDLIGHATSAGLQVAITPSPTPLVTTAAIARLREVGVTRMAISLDGADAQTHDRMRGVSGSYQRALEIMGDARKLGIPLQVNTTVTPHNLGQIDAMAELLAQQQIVLWSVFFLVPIGRAAQSQRLAAEDYETVFEKLWRQTQRQPYAIKTTEAPHYRRYVLLRRGQTAPHGHQMSPSQVRRAPLGVNDGKGVMFVSHCGMIHPSGFMPIVCGMFPLDDVVQVYQKSPIFQGLRDPDRLDGKCGVCEYRHICGGSRARAYAVTGDPFAQEPDCNFVPAVLQ